MRAAERYVQTVLQVLAAAHPDRPPTLQEVVELMDPGRLTGVLRHVDRPLRERVQDYRAGLTHDQLSAIRGLQTRLAIMTESHIGPFLAPPRDPQADMIDLRAALNGPEVVVFSLNSSRYGQLASQIGSLAVQDLVSVSGVRLDEPRNGRALEPAMIGIDEFSGIGTDHVGALLARGREAGMPVFVSTQEFVDFERASPGFRDLVLGVTAVNIFHRQERAGVGADDRADRRHRDGVGGDAPDRRRAPRWLRNRPRDPPSRRAVHHRSERDPNAPPGPGGRDLEDRGSRARRQCGSHRRGGRGRSDDHVRGGSRGRGRPGAVRGGWAGTDHAHKPQRLLAKRLEAVQLVARTRRRRPPRRPRRSGHRGSRGRGRRRSSPRGRERGARARSGRPGEPRSSASGNRARPRPRRSARAFARRPTPGRRRPGARHPPTRHRGSTPARRWITPIAGRHPRRVTPRPASPGRRRTPRRCCAAG